MALDTFLEDPLVDELLVELESSSEDAFLSEDEESSELSVDEDLSETALSVELLLSSDVTDLLVVDAAFLVVESTVFEELADLLEVSLADESLLLADGVAVGVAVSSVFSLLSPSP